MAQKPKLNEAWMGGTYTLQGNSMGSRESINIYLQSGEGQAKYSELVLGTPGTQALVILSEDGLPLEAPCRGMWLAGASPNQGSNLYWVFGSKLGYTYKDYTGAYVSNVLQDIGLDTTKVSFTDNGFQIVVATGTSMYLVDIFDSSANGFIANQITDITSVLPFKAPQQVVYLAGRIYAITNPFIGGASSLQSAVNANLIWYSELADASTWTALGFVPADLNSDPITAITVRQGDIWAHGPRSYQIYQTSSDPDNPLVYVPGSGVEIGTNAPNSVTSIGSEIFWLGSNSAGRNEVFMSQSMGAIRISTHAIETALSDLNELSNDAYAFAYVESGHTFYVLSIPPGPYTFEGSERYSDGLTFCYDTLTRMWHRRASRNPVTGVLEAWQPKFAVFAWGKVVVGNSLWSTIMELRNDVYTDYDPTTLEGKKPILRRYQGPVFYDTMQLFVLDEFMWDIITGHGPLNGLSSDPVAQLRISYDGGNTFGNILTEPLARTGDYGMQVRWNGLGSSRALVVQVTITEDMQFMAGQARLRTRLSEKP